MGQHVQQQMHAAMTLPVRRLTRERRSREE